MYILPGPLAADFGDKLPPSRRVRLHGDLVLLQSIELCIRVGRLPVGAWLEPGRFEISRGFDLHVVPGSSAATPRMLAPILVSQCGAN